MTDPTRLDAPSQRPQERDKPGLGHPCPCLECGTPFTPRQADAEFCAPACRKTWNNRRLLRGAELYDLFMALRWDRRIATGLHVFTLLSRLAAIYRREDLDERDGRRSWASAARIIARRPYLRAARLAEGRSK